MAMDFRILILADCSSGKTELINAYIKEEAFVGPSSSTIGVAHSPLPAVSVPSISGGSLYIIDGPCNCSKRQERGQEERTIASTSKQLARADAIVLVHKQGDAQAAAHLKDFWLPSITKAKPSAKGKEPTRPPIVIASLSGGADFANGQQEPLLELSEFPEVEAVIDCSTADADSIAQAFIQAQRAVLCPLQTVFDRSTRTFRQDALAAFARITALVCRNSDRFSGGHLASLQREVFGNAIDPDDARRVLSLLEDAKGGDTQACVSPVDTFARLMTVFVDNGRKDNVWRILRHFGYDADLRTSSSYGDAKISLKSDGSEVLEFSDQAWHFLTTAWADCIEPSDKSQATQQLLRLLESWIPDQGCSLEQWQAAWVLQLVTDHKGASAGLATLGFPHRFMHRDAGGAAKNVRKKVSAPMAPAFTSLRSRGGRKDMQKRRAFSCLVFGDPQALDLLSCKGNRALPLLEGRFAVLQPIADLSQLSIRRMASADLVLYVYADVPSDDDMLEKHSSQHQLDLLTRVRETAKSELLSAPGAVIGVRDVVPEDNKKTSDKDTAGTAVPSLTPSQAAVEFCQATRLAAPLVVKSGDEDELARLLERLILRSSTRRSVNTDEGLQRWLLLTGALAAACAVGYVVLQRTNYGQYIVRQYLGKG